MDKTHLIMIAFGLVSAILYFATPNTKKNDPNWMKLGSVAIYISIIIGIIGLFLLIRDLIFK